MSNSGDALGPVAETLVASPCGTLGGTIRVPGDKSISHRAVMLASIADGASELRGFLPGADCEATLAAFQAMGVAVERHSRTHLTIHGVGIDGLNAPDHDLDMGNSGTAMRLLAGLLCGQRFATTMTGDASLQGRPMRRIVDPLNRMGARILATDRGTPPLRIEPSTLCGIDYALPVASAQVKSSLLLAGLYADGETSLLEPAPTRDHTERMLRGFGYSVRGDGRRIALRGGGRLRATEVSVPTDLSSAAFFLVAASIAERADLLLENVGINPTRTGVLDILKLMGADLSLLNAREENGEPIADIRVRSAPLHGVRIPEEAVALAIDEFPVLFVAAAVARGTTTLTGAAELRVKESDRIQTMADGLNTLGVDAQPTPDGIVITGGRIGGGRVDSHGDHRIAMAFAVASVAAEGRIRIDDCANIATSFPDFVPLARRVGLVIDVGD